jgi:hypothetical protein
MSLVDFTPFVDGVALSADTVSTYFHKNTRQNSLSVINGGLDAANLDVTAIDYNFVQKRAASSAGIVSGTRNLDYFGGGRRKIQSDFRGIGDVESINAERYVAIPGGAIQFRLDYPSYVLVTWHVHWTNDCMASEDTDIANGGGSWVRLFVDGKPADGGYDSVALTDSSQVRAVGQTCWPSSSSLSAALDNKLLRDRNKSRFWCGHIWLDTKAKGWHSVSLRVCSNSDVAQTRVRARSMKYIAFKRGDT